jgi:putative FmdB family regulatory protein
MPTYTYVCEECGAEFEAFASIKKKETGWRPECPECGSPQTRQTFKAVAVIAGSRRSRFDGSCCSAGRGQTR